MHSPKRSAAFGGAPRFPGPREKDPRDYYMPRSEFGKAHYGGRVSSSFGGHTRGAWAHGVDGPAPGAYDLKSTMERYMARPQSAKPTAAFGSAPRGGAHGDYLPGPGAYDGQQSTFHKAAIRSKRPTMAGRTPPAYGGAADGVPAPGSYEIPSTMQKYMARPQSARPSAAFGTARGRNAAGDDGLPGPGYYNSDPYSLSYRAASARTRRSTMPGRAPPIYASDDAPGPGHYDHYTSFATPTRQRPSAAFGTARGRAAGYDDDIPGPGHYYADGYSLSHRAASARARHAPFPGRSPPIYASDDAPGPGQYDARPGFMHDSRAGGLSFARAQRYQDRPDEEPGPGFYHKDRWRFPNRPRSAFARAQRFYTPQD
eukprot:tig00020610_g12070.t1